MPSPPHEFNLKWWGGLARSRWTKEGGYAENLFLLFFRLPVVYLVYVTDFIHLSITLYRRMSATHKNRAYSFLQNVGEHENTIFQKKTSHTHTDTHTPTS